MLATYENEKTSLRSGFFLQKLCLQNVLHGNRKVTPDQVIQAFNRQPDRKNKYKLAIARFKAECCLKCLPLYGYQVTPGEVVKDFPGSPEGKLGIARFKEQCCLKGLMLNGRQISPNAVVKDYQAANAKLELVRFQEQCCLRGLLLNGRQFTPDEVVRGYQALKATLSLARFQEQCCLKGLLLNGQQVTTDVVVKNYQAIKATLEEARFKAECCLRRQTLNGRQVTADEVVEGYQIANAPLELARFKEQCCLWGLILNGQLVTPDSVVRDFPDSPEGGLGIARFQAECCLRGLLLNGQQVTPGAVVKDYERGGWLLERAIFYAQLALNAKALDQNCLDDQKVLEAFNDVPGDYSSRQARYLMQSLKPPQRYDDANEAQNVLQKAWQILSNVSVRDDEQLRLKCTLQFMAMQYELTIDHLRVTAEQVLQSITALRCSYQNSRLHFFFLAQCHIARQPVNGRQIHREQVQECLQSFPEGSRLRHALGCWFEQCSSAANITDSLLVKRVSAVTSGSDNSDGYKNFVVQQETSVAIAAGAVQTRKYLPNEWIATSGPETPNHQIPQLNALTLKTLEIIQEINGANNDPAILITGSYSRFLQNLCPVFNDIDIICTTEASARALFDTLQSLNTDRDFEIPKNITIRLIPGCPAIKLPNAYNIELEYGDLGTRAMGIQVSVDARVIHDNAERLAVHVPGVERPVWYLSFAEETRLLNDTLEHLAENLDALTGQLQQGAVFHLPRTILFNFPQSPDERIYGLLMRTLLTLNKARQFIALHSEQNPGSPDCRTDQLQQEQQRLYGLSANLQAKLHGHVCLAAFEQRVNDWLTTTHHVNDYEIKRKAFVKALLALMHPE
ncbi:MULTISPECIES: hypothetical protein [unclassified Endozoicomonas]|uniref:hypothetical protein n=1 Tax=unclassified Endozoicomonas TaxID=2644528 RepID=UPI003BB70AB6